MRCPRGNKCTATYKKRKGQALVEFALVLPFLILLVLGIMEFGWLTKNQLTIDNAAREGARSAALGKTTTDITSVINNQTSTVPYSSTQLTITMKRDDNSSGTNDYIYANTLKDTTDSNGNSVNDAPAGSMIKVTVSIPEHSLTGFFPFLNNRTISAAVVMRREP
jgi:Flp pilus assembly protein TadG